jgi:hypothetical protein
LAKSWKKHPGESKTLGLLKVSTKEIKMLKLASKIYLLPATSTRFSNSFIISNNLGNHSFLFIFMVKMQKIRKILPMKFKKSLPSSNTPLRRSAQPNLFAKILKWEDSPSTPPCRWM